MLKLTVALFMGVNLLSLVVSAEDYSFASAIGEYSKNPITILPLAISLICLIICIIMLIKSRKKTTENKSVINWQSAIINSVGSDFEAIAFVEKKPDKTQDIASVYKESALFKSSIQDWDSDRSMVGRLNKIAETIPDVNDRKSFLRTTKREVILRELSEKDVYSVNFEFCINDKNYIYQMKFYAQRAESGRLIGFVLGVKDLADDIQSEVDKRRTVETMIKKRTAELEERNRELNRLSSSIMELMGEMVESRDINSGKHVRRVKGYTCLIAEEVRKLYPQYGLTERAVKLITNTSSLHDLGKITISDSILLKPDKLTPEEKEIMKTHSDVGANIVSQMRGYWSDEFIDTAYDICRYHHEKWDGNGYPCHLKGEEIPISAQIVSLADVYDALTNNRPYKEAISHESAIEMILNGECGCFSEKMLNCLKSCASEIKRYKDNSDEFMALAEMNSDIPEREPESDYYDNNDIFKNICILIVDDNMMFREINREILEDCGAIVSVACDGQEAVDLLKEGKESYDIVLMDINMPVMDGITAIKEIRAGENENDGRIPIVVMSADCSDKQTVDCLEAGADDCATKPLVISELSKIIISIMHKKSTSITKKLEDTIRIATTDALTHVKNITAYTDAISELSENLKHPGTEFAIIMCDVNNLKKENDTHGHIKGDMYICNCAKVISDVFANSPVYRIGGDEFAVILDGVDYRNRNDLMKKLADKVAEASALASADEGRASFAYGIGVYDKYSDVSIADVVKKADREMYKRKADMNL